MEQELGGFSNPYWLARRTAELKGGVAVVIADAVNSHSKSGFRQRFFRSTMASSASSVPSDCSHSPTKDRIFTIITLAKFTSDPLLSPDLVPCSFRVCPKLFVPFKASASQQTLRHRFATWQKHVSSVPTECWWNSSKTVSRLRSVSSRSFSNLQSVSATPPTQRKRSGLAMNWAEWSLATDAIPQPNPKAQSSLWHLLQSGERNSRMHGRAGESAVRTEISKRQG